MAKCPLCGKEVSSDDLKFQFYDNYGSEHYVCSKCNDALDSLAENDENSIKALNYINKYSPGCTDEDMRIWLNDVVDSYTENSEEYAEEYAKEDSFASSDTTFWISSLKGVYKFVFFVIIIIGIILCAILCSNELIGLGVIALIVSILIAVMAVGFAIVFLDLARDIHQIRNLLEEQRNDKE